MNQDPPNPEVSSPSIPTGPDSIPPNRMKKTTETRGIGFNKTLVQEFLHLRRQAVQAKDTVSIKSLDVIIDGIKELTFAVEDDKTGKGKAFEFTSPAYVLFSNLAKYPNDPVQLRRAGAHYFVEWSLPTAALRHFERALNLSPADKTLPMLMEIAALAIERKSETSKPVSD